MALQKQVFIHTHTYITDTPTRNVMIHNLGVLIYILSLLYHNTVSDILYDTVKCELADF